MTFASLGLAPALARAAAEMGFAAPTPVQAAAIGPVLAGADLLATASTGSGKTAAFALPLLQRLPPQPAAGPRPVHALVLVPTRELAAQVGDVLRQLARSAGGGARAGCKVAVAFGGVSINPQMMALRGGADVLVATPGRLLDLVEHNAVALSAVQMLVLDEADRLLDLGFAEELARVLALLPARRQNLFFSATFAPDVQALAGTLLHKPVRIDVVDAPAAAPAILQRAIAVDVARRTELLRHLLLTSGWDRTLVFVATQYAATHVAWKLYKNGIFATPFHGGLSQGARQQVLAEFKNGQWDVVVTTDLAARGLDIALLPAVVNYDLPRSAVDYTHRIGRTGRAGESGVAVSFVSADTEPHWRLIEKRQGLVLPLEHIAGFEPVQPVAVTVAPGGGAAADATDAAGSMTAAPGTGGIKGKRPSKKDKLRAAARAAPPPG